MQSLQFFARQARRYASAGLLAACLAATAAHAADDTLWAAASDASGKAYFAQHSLGDGAAAPGSANYFEAPNGAGARSGPYQSAPNFRRMASCIMPASTNARA